MTVGCNGMLGARWFSLQALPDQRRAALLAEYPQEEYRFAADSKEHCVRESVEERPSKTPTKHVRESLGIVRDDGNGFVKGRLKL